MRIPTTLWGLVYVTVAGCAHSKPVLPPVVAAKAGPQPWLQTDSAVYTFQSRVHDPANGSLETVHELWIRARYTNHLAKPLRLTSCPTLESPDLVITQGDTLVEAYRRLRAGLCKGQGVILQPGESYDLKVAIVTGDNPAFPQLIGAPGPFRLVLSAALSTKPDGKMTFIRDLPDSARLSNEFQIRAP